MPRKPTISFLGAGALATGLAVRLREAGYRIDEVVVRKGRAALSHGRKLAAQLGARAVEFEQAEFSADVIWFAVPDDSIAACAQSLALRRAWKKQVALHSSGALSSDELQVLRERGASCASLHPMMSFVHSTPPALKGVSFAVEGDRAASAVARSIAAKLGGKVFSIRKDAKPLYHAFGAFLSPLLVAELTAAESVAKSAGIPREAIASAMVPIVLRTLENFFQRGGAASFSGPLLRGDVETISRHVRALARKKEADVYRALAGYAVEKLPVKNRAALERALLNPR